MISSIVQIGRVLISYAHISAMAKTGVTVV